jgi:hypothetical protein
MRYTGSEHQQTVVKPSSKVWKFLIHDRQEQPSSLGRPRTNLEPKSFFFRNLSSKFQKISNLRQKFSRKPLIPRN